MTEKLYNHKTLAAIEQFRGIQTSENQAAYNRVCREQWEIQNSVK